MALLFQDLQRGLIISSTPVNAALSAGTIVTMTADGWEAADNETEAQGILMVDVVAAPDEDSLGEGNSYAGGITDMNAKVYVGEVGPVDTGDCVCLVPNTARANFTVGGSVYVGNGLLYASAQNAGDPVGVVLDTDSERVKVRFRFVY